MQNEEEKNYDSVLVVARREVSWLAAAVIVLLLTAFVVGYVVGQRCAVRDMLVRAQQTSALEDDENDQDAGMPISGQTPVSGQPAANTTTAQVAAPAAAGPMSPVAKSVEPALDYYGQWRYKNFGAAQSAVDKAKQAGIVGLRIKRESARPGRRKKRSFVYSVLTPPYSDKNSFDQDLAKLKQVLKIDTVTIHTTKRMNA